VLDHQRAVCGLEHRRLPRLGDSRSAAGFTARCRPRSRRAVGVAARGSTADRGCNGRRRAASCSAHRLHRRRSASSDRHRWQVRRMGDRRQRRAPAPGCECIRERESDTWETPEPPYAALRCQVETVAPTTPIRHARDASPASPSSPRQMPPALPSAALHRRSSNAEGNDDSPPTRQPTGGPLVTFPDGSRACYLARCRADQGLKQVAHLMLLGQGVA
jgi:hypothetical protein